MPYETLSDVYPDKTKNLALALEEKAFDADILLFNLDQETPWIPLSLQAPTGPSKKVIILLDRDIELPDALSFDHVVRYSTNPAGLKKLYSSFESIFKAVLNPDKIAEAENLYKLKFYDAAIVSAANHLYEFLRNRALSVFGAKHFQSRPLRFYSMKELVILLMRKKKLKIKYKGKPIEWKRIVAVRNQAVHGNIANSESDLCLWYLDEVRKLLEINKNDQTR